ncbi:hypothetical protein Tco_0302878 [Tanacetum coccineum]
MLSCPSLRGSLKKAVKDSVNATQPRLTSPYQHKPELKPNKDFEAKYNKVKARLALLSPEEVSFDDNEVVEAKVLMALAEEEEGSVSKESARNGEWVQISMRKLYKAKVVILPNHDTGTILPAESQINTTNPLVAVTDSSSTDYDSADESSISSTLLPPLEKLVGAEPISRPKTIKSILKSNSTFKAEALKGVIINDPSSAPAKGNKSASALKINSAPAGKLKNVKTEDDIPLAIVMKELNELKLKISINQSSYSRNNQSQQVPQNALQNNYKTQFKRGCELCGLNNHLSEIFYKVLYCKKCERTNHRTCDHAEYMSTMNLSQHIKSQGGSSSRSRTPRPSKRFFPPCIHCGRIDYLSDDCLYYPICRLCRSYDHDTNGHNRIISLEREIKPRNPQHVFKRCEVCGSTVHTKTDHHDIEWFRRGEALQAEALNSSNAN